MIILGKEHKVKLGLRFLENVTKGEGISLSEVFVKFESDTLLFLPKLIWYAINTASADSVTLDDVYDHLDEVGLQSDEVKKFIEDFSASIMVHVPKEEAVGKQKKAPAPKK